MGESTCASTAPDLATTSSLSQRCGAAAVLTAATSGLSVAREPRLVRERFEEDVRALLRARSFALRDGATAPKPAPNAITLDVPALSPDRRTRIEAVFDASRRLDAWTHQVLEAGAHVAALILELERLHVRRVERRPRDGAAPLIGSSPAIQQVRDRIERVAVTDFTVLIEGESGTGKELVARQVHDLSHRRKGPFVAVNCAALVESLVEAELFGIEDRTATGVRGRLGKFEHADRGTLFLDEVSDLSGAAQAKLLRTIQDFAVERVGGHGSRRVDTRIIVATNRPLADLVASGRFRIDLFYRLSGVEIVVPPLRQRRSDILELARYFLERYRPARPLQLSEAAGDALLAYAWPGNVRELERVIERAVALATGDSLQLDDLPPALLAGYTDAVVPSAHNGDTLRAWASRYTRLVLERCRNNKRRACRELGISYHTLQNHLRFRPEAQKRAKAS
jgi:transcriptional regulator with PAS, ATPase and Fis domain